MNIVIIDDDVNTLELITTKVSQLKSNEDIVYTFNNYDDYLRLLKSNIGIDLAIMDIDLGEKSGIDLALETNIISPYTQIIYLSSYYEYASDVYQSQHLMFIHKNHLDKYLMMAIEKAKLEINKIHSHKLSIYWNKVKYDIDMFDIIFIERDKRTSIIHTSNKNYKTSLTIEKLFNLLDEDFIIVHKSYLVNMEYIKVIDKTTLLLKDGSIIPLSRSHQKMVKTKYTDFLTGYVK